MVADGLSIINADFSSTSFRVSRVSIGPHNFLGNRHRLSLGRQDRRQLPAGDKGMIPLDGKSAKDAGPSGLAHASRFRDRLSGTAGSTTCETGDELRRRLAAKNRYNIQTMGVFLFAGGCTSSCSPSSAWPPSIFTMRTHMR